jgi:phenylpropionate dioxygenase-like ring-hydroxylating dioxygenase large terminal subunit
VAVNYKVEWPMSLQAPADSLEAKQPAVDNGIDVPDPSRYSSADYMKKEWQHLWPRVWLLAGVTPDLPESGDYQVFEIGHEEILLVRQDDASIKAFYNVCPHRGNRISLNDRGSVAKFTCAFHGWQFACDGKLEKITDEATFDPRVIAHRPGLNEVRCDFIGGLIFVNLDGKAPPLREWIGRPPGYIENYEIDKMNVVRHVRSEWRANWKTGIDAFYETYHLPFIPADPGRDGGFQSVRSVSERLQPHDRAHRREIASRGRSGQRRSVPAVHDEGGRHRSGQVQRHGTRSARGHTTGEARARQALRPGLLRQAHRRAAYR